MSNQIIAVELILLSTGTLMYLQLLKYLDVNEYRLIRAAKLSCVSAATQLLAGLAVFMFIQDEYFRIISLAGIIASSIALGMVLRNRMIISRLKAYMVSTGVTIGSSVITILLAVVLFAL